MKLENVVFADVDEVELAHATVLEEHGGKPAYATEDDECGRAFRGTLER